MQKRWKIKLLEGHRDYLISKQAENKDPAEPAAFFERQIQNVEFELKCERKPKKTPPLYKLLL